MANLEKLCTPECVVEFPWIFEPNKKFDPVVGVYSITCVMDESEPWQRLIKHLQMRLDEFYDITCKLARKKLKKCEHLPWKTQKTKDGEVVKNQDGTPKKIFVAKNKAVGTKKDGTKFSLTPRVVGPDPSQVLTATDLEGRLGNGSRCKIGFDVNPWNVDAQGVGISCLLRMVQIISPVYYDPNGGFTDLSSDEVDGGGFKKVLSDWLKPKGPNGKPPSSGSGNGNKAVPPKEFMEGISGQDVDNILY